MEPSSWTCDGLISEKHPSLEMTPFSKALGSLFSRPRGGSAVEAWPDGTCENSFRVFRVSEKRCQRVMGPKVLPEPGFPDGQSAQGGACHTQGGLPAKHGAGSAPSPLVGSCPAPRGCCEVVQAQAGAGGWGGLPACSPEGCVWVAADGSGGRWGPSCELGPVALPPTRPQLFPCSVP